MGVPGERHAVRSGHLVEGQPLDGVLVVVLLEVSLIGAQGGQLREPGIIQRNRPARQCHSRELTSLRLRPPGAAAPWPRAPVA